MSQVYCAVYRERSCFSFDKTDAILEKYEKHIKSFGYTTDPIDMLINEGVVVRFADQAGMDRIDGVSVYGVSPSSILDESMEFTYKETEKSWLGATEQLYTARGSQGVGMARTF